MTGIILQQQDKLGRMYLETLQSISSRHMQISENNKLVMKNRKGASSVYVTNSRQFSHTSPRTLLAIIRMAQAIARLHFRELVDISDVDEALRLIKAAKSSLNDHVGSSNRDTSKATQVYEIIRSMHATSQGNDLAIDEIRRRVTGRGFTEDEMWSTIKEYTDFGVLFTAGENTRLRFVVDDEMSDMDID